MNTNLWWATKDPDRGIENTQRAARVLSYLYERKSPPLYKDIQSDMGLTYWQTVRAVGLLVCMEFAVVCVKAVWNGQNYIYPHVVMVDATRCEDGD